MATVLSAVQTGLASIISGLAKITFGDLSTAFKAAADEVRLSAEATGAVADAFGEKAGEAFDRAAEGAEQARAGWAGLTGSAEATTAATTASAAAFTDMAAAMQAAGDGAQEAGQKAASAAEAQRVKAEEARASVAGLRDEYAKAIATGNLELAAQKLEELRKANVAAAGSASANSKAQEQAAAEIAAAFSRAGIETKEALEVAAKTALRDFELIRDSGKATAIGLSEAWKRAAETAIAAGNGVAPGWVEAQAAMRGFEVVLDSAGRSTLKLRDAQTDAMQAAHGLAGALREVTSARERDIEAREKANALQERQNALENKRLGRDAKGFSTDKNGNTVVAGSDLGTLTGIAAFLKNAGVDDDAKARSIAREFADENGNVQFFNNPGQKKYGGDGGTLSMALLKAAEKVTFGPGSGSPGTPTTIPRHESFRNVRVDINLNGSSLGAVNTDNAGADIIQDLMARLGQAKGVAST